MPPGANNYYRAMNWLFIDAVGWEYDVATPLTQPLGGSQSALCYLAAELARRGHRVAVACGSTQDKEVMGVRCVGFETASRGVLSSPWDAVVVLNGPGDGCLEVRRHVRPNTPLVLWTQHDVGQPAVAQLALPEARLGWDRFVFVSEWQRSQYLDSFGLPADRTAVLRNAISPCFERLFDSEDALVSAKLGLPQLAYTSTPFRGLEWLVDLFPAVRQQHPTTELHVYSSMQVYRQEPAADEHLLLYQRCRLTEGIHYHGSIPQRDLALAMRRVDLLSYPNTFAETSCIAVMEAMAAGALVLTSDLGALAETTMGFARLVSGAEQEDLSQFMGSYQAQLLDLLNERSRDATQFARARWKQVEELNRSCTWSRRAEQWEAWVAS